MKYVHDRAQKFCVLISDWAGDQSIHGPFSSREAVYRWLRPKFGVYEGTGCIRNGVQIEGLGEATWDIFELRGTRDGLR
jgi:hypothetical protein